MIELTQRCNPATSEIAATCANKLEYKKGRNYLKKKIFNRFKIYVFYMASGSGQLTGASSSEESEILLIYPLILLWELYGTTGTESEIARSRIIH